MLLLVMHESGTWRVRPGQVLTFGRGAGCMVRLPAADRGVSRTAGSLAFAGGSWWLRNDSSSSVLYVSGDRGFRVDLPPGMRAPVQQWHAKIRLQGVLDSYTLRLRLPDLDDAPGQDPGTGRGGGAPAGPTGDTWSPAPGAAHPCPARTGSSWPPGSSSTLTGSMSARPHHGRLRRRRSGSAGRRTRWPSGVRTSVTVTRGWGFPGCAGHARWRSLRCFSSRRASLPPTTCAASPPASARTARRLTVPPGLVGRCPQMGGCPPFLGDQGRSVWGTTEAGLRPAAERPIFSPTVTFSKITGQANVTWLLVIRDVSGSACRALYEQSQRLAGAGPLAPGTGYGGSGCGFC